MEIKGQTALVTGAGSGIGLAIALAFAHEGASVIATDVDTVRLDWLKAKASLEGLPIQTANLDVTNRESWVEIAAAHPEVTILVNNAGIGFWGSVFNTPRKAWEKILAVNLMGVVNGCEVFGSQMVASGKPGRIVNVASSASLNPVPNLGAYSASKFAVEGFSDVLAMELAETPVEIITLHPGIIDTAIVHDRSASAQNITPEQMDKVQHYYRTKGCLPEQVGADVVAGIKAGKARIMSGPQSRISQFMRHFVPVGLKRKLTRKGAAEIGYLT